MQANVKTGIDQSKSNELIKYSGSSLDPCQMPPKAGAALG